MSEHPFQARLNVIEELGASVDDQQSACYDRLQQVIGAKLAYQVAAKKIMGEIAKILKADLDENGRIQDREVAEIVMRYIQKAAGLCQHLSGEAATSEIMINGELEGYKNVIKKMKKARDETANRLLEVSGNPQTVVPLVPPRLADRREEARRARETAQEKASESVEEA